MRKIYLSLAGLGAFALPCLIAAQAMSNSTKGLAKASASHDSSHALIEHPFQWQDPTKKGYKPYYMCKECCPSGPREARYSFEDKTKKTTISSITLGAREGIETSSINAWDEILNADPSSFVSLDQVSQGGDSKAVYIYDYRYRCAYFSRSGIVGEGDGEASSFSFSTSSKTIGSVSFSYRYLNYGTKQGEEGGTFYSALGQFVSEGDSGEVKEGLVLDDLLENDDEWHSITLDYSSVSSSSKLLPSFKGFTVKFADLRGYFMISNLEYTVGKTKKEADEEAAEKKSKGIEPSLSSDRKTLTYGIYPQKKVSDSEILASLGKLSPDSNGFYCLNDVYYAKAKANPPSDKSLFDEGTKIVSGTEYWYRCDPIEWKVLSISGTSVSLVSSLLLDVQRYDDSSNDYGESEIRSWLNGAFLSSAFCLDSSFLQESKVDNSVASTGATSNENVCEDTHDKVYLLSYKDYKNASYFSSDSSRVCGTTDWTRANDLYCETDSPFEASYWTRSPDPLYSSYAYRVGIDGALGRIMVNNSDYGVRPGITISLTK